MMVMRSGQTVTRVLGTLFVLSSVSGAQGSGTGERATILGVTGSGFIGPYDHETILGLGGLVGLEQKLSDGISFRALASLQRGISTSDNLNICRPDGLDGCLPAPLLPLWLSSFEANAVVTPLPKFPVRFVAGLGYAIAIDARETFRGARKTSLPAEGVFVIRRGLEITLGTSPRAPRLQFTKAVFGSDLFSLKRVDALTLLMVR
jgi:hypothetical protein